MMQCLHLLGWDCDVSEARILIRVFLVEQDLMINNY
jgi:hypothetical protein